PTSPAATAASASSVRVTWAAPASSAPPSSYVLRRTAPSAASVCTVTVPATLSCDDTGLNSATTYSYTVEARIGTSWTSGQTAAVSATTPSSGPPNFSVELLSANPQTAGTAFNVRLTARTGTTTDTSYSGSRTIAFSGPSASPNSTQPKYRTAGVTFTGGVGTAAVTLYRSETVSLLASESTRSGSISVTVQPAAVALSFTSSTPSCSTGSITLANGATWTSKVSRTTDPYGNAPASPAPQAEVTVTNAPTATALTISAGANETTAGFNVSRPGDNNGLVVTASSPGYAPVSCTVYKN
ncbi:MAG: fibronectin type III domain-containing protein, partial [Actinomycetota bacterium]|nr:fibronectin type III domain-containing protein [Actinomycetota bacterium]